ncbi:MAG: UDP-N-acetylglucosamine--N-acetylmuramyl-(pentapeptide) pyrophosphoryl-undecaprenol N-acetylglucosamine transferase, partial [Oscillospiraceae bacterium]|nr:UDP-N-acetylglucosamine--N-acetylmuramyl-(pentapeptide) pyrophosphoryl-undecaprenol N-acetylglucosamine transferase [Oscillospiraceae bacterium]
MRILFVCGGTAGHINPALVVAEKFKDKSTTAKILFVGAPDSMEEKLVGAAGFDFVPIVVEGLSRKLSIKGVIRNINSLKVLARASGRAKEIIRNFQPNLIFGTGGYITYPILKHGMKMGVKTAIHEQNAFPGITNKALAKKADRVFVANTQAANLLKTRNPPIVTGNPIRESLIYTSGQKARIRLGLDEKPLIYSAGGSLGAHTVNKIVADIIAWHAGKNLVNHI